MSLRTVEVYASYQGEGINTSKPTVFVRFAGCNLKCPLWPCDTQHAIDPKIFGKTQKFWSPEALAEEVLNFNVTNICLTGGEVFLQEKESLRAFVELLHTAGRNIECFTNGSLAWDEDTSTMISSLILDWKLPGSGEDKIYKDNEAFQKNFSVLGITDVIKFTIANVEDYLVAKQLWHSEIVQIEAFERPTVYCGIVWANPFVSSEMLCRMMLEDDLPWHLNVQTHKFIWSPDKIGV